MARSPQPVTHAFPETFAEFPNRFWQRDKLYSLPALAQQFPQIKAPVSIQLFWVGVAQLRWAQSRQSM